MTLQPFVGPSPLLQFRNLFCTDSRTPWMGDQPVAKPLPTHRDIHAFNGIRTHYPSFRESEASSYLRPRGHCDRRYYILASYFVCEISLVCRCHSTKYGHSVHSVSQPSYTRRHNTSPKYKEHKQGENTVT
jgi:hypothetical protein